MKGNYEKADYAAQTGVGKYFTLYYSSDYADIFFNVIKN